MAQICSKCSQANPPEAAYCYFDGAILDGHGRRGGPLNAGSAPFPSQFVFPSGQSCRNFDQLALACQQSWSVALDLLRQGYFASFLSGLGRVDLAKAAQEAARFPDIDRGLDQFLAKLPTQVLQAPKLVAEPSDINLGIVPFGTDRTFELQLSNHGMRLLYGSVVSDSKWLTLGDPPGNPQKLFQFGSDGTIVVRIRGQHLRAGNKPLEGHLGIESNGGQTTITVRAEVPVKPLRAGVLAGALTPRQVAEKAKAAPKEAAPLFENGAVAAWFKENGWIYPVQGPPASGLGAVQQFFEALGLATAPKVEVTEKALNLSGHPGQRLRAALEVRTQERRPVYAHATADQPWLDVSKTNLNGRVAVIEVVVPSVPPWSGQTLQAKIKITANGNQRFIIPFTLTITGGASSGFVPTVEPIPVTPVYATTPVLPKSTASLAYGQALPVQPISPPTASEPARPLPVLFPPPVQLLSSSPQLPTLAIPTAPPRPEPRRAPTWLHLVPAVFLLLILLGLILRDLFEPRLTIAGDLGDGIPIDGRPRVAAYFDRPSKDIPDPTLGTTMSFGVVALGPSPKDGKLLTYDPHGRTNSTVVRIDGVDQLFGIGDGRWEARDTTSGSKWQGAQSIWQFEKKIKVTQTVEVVPGEPVEVDEGHKRFLDTCLVRYRLENTDSVAHTVGLRFLLDTLIGANDGVPFTVPGLGHLIDKKHDFTAPKSLPDFIQVLEKEDLKNPGLIAFLNLKVGRIEPPQRVSLTHWPEDRKVRYQWNVPLRAFDDGDDPEVKDSAVVLYWNEQPLEPNRVREVGFSYGLGSVAATTSALGLIVGGNMTLGNELTVVALVSNPKAGQKVELKLPDGLTLVEGNAIQDVPPALVQGRPVPVTWRVRSTWKGTFVIEVQSGSTTQRKSLTIREASIF